MRSFLFLYSFVMIGGALLTLALVPRSLKDTGVERERLAEELPGADFETMVTAGYRLNVLMQVVEIAYYYLLLSYAGPEWQFLYGGFAFGVIHIFYLVLGRLERRRLAGGSTRTRLARFWIWLTAFLTVLELAYLFWVTYMLVPLSP